MQVRGDGGRRERSRQVAGERHGRSRGTGAGGVACSLGLECNIDFFHVLRAVLGRRPAVFCCQSRTDQIPISFTFAYQNRIVFFAILIFHFSTLPAT